jgi:predicted DNA-binding transcriptional regulator AlpA
MAQDDIIILLKSDFNALNAKIDLILSKMGKSENNSFQHLDKWIPEKDVKKLLGLSTTSLWKLRKEGKLEFSKPNNSTVYYAKESILKWIETTRKEAFQNPAKNK